MPVTGFCEKKIIRNVCERHKTLLFQNTGWLKNVPLNETQFLNN